MAFTYSLTTDAGKLRLKIADTNPAAYAFEDDEIAEFLSEGGSIIEGVILALRSLLASRALRVKRASLPGLSYDDTAQVEAIQGLLALYGGTMPTATVRMPAASDMDSGFVDPTPTVFTS